MTGNAIDLRPALDADSPGIIELIARCYAEYPGNVLDVDREEPGLRSPARSYDAFWVAERGGIVGCAALVLQRADSSAFVEMKKVYLEPTLRGTGLAQRLLACVEEWAIRAQVSRVELWSDTRFTRAHRFYLKQGYRRSGRVRDLHDLSRSIEYHFVRDLELPRAAPP
jgi:GNAT superfamily N-acetyltransferase